MSARNFWSATFCALLFAGCGGGGGGSRAPSTPGQTTYSATSGVAQKGPLIRGSSVTVQELDSALAPNGKQYTYQISSDLGIFNPSSAFTSPLLSVNATGYYFDEIRNAVSAGPVTLNAYADLAAGQTLGVNLLTTLSYQRIQTLMKNSQVTFAEARVRAEREVLAAFGIPAGDYGQFTTLDLSGDDDGDHILAALSAMFVYGNTPGALAQQIAAIQQDLGDDGQLTSLTLKATLDAAARAIDPALVAANLSQRYASVGAQYSSADIAAWLDQDGDGVLHRFDYEVANASADSSFALPSTFVARLVGTSVSVTGGELIVNGVPVAGAANVVAGDVVSVSPNVGIFPNGITRIYVLSNGNKLGQVSFLRSLLSLEVSPDLPSLPKGLSQQFLATGTFSDGSVADVSGSVEWKSSATGVASINASTGLAQTTGVGSTGITASKGTVTKSVTLTVTPAVVQFISIAPNPATSGIGISIQLTATGTYSDGATLDVTTSSTWASSSPAVAAVVSTTGRLTGQSLGSASISATLGSVVGNVAASITSDRWYPAGTLRSAHCNHQATLLQTGKVLVTGGVCSIGAEATAEIYDPATNAWTSVAPMHVERAFYTATLLADGRVLVAGGSGIGGPWPPNRSVEIYDPVTNTWSLAPSMSVERTRHTATRLADGRVLIAGGMAQNGFNRTAEIFDPASGTWSPAGDLSADRANHAAVRLPNGRVLVAGGQSANASYTSAEIFDPVSNTWSMADAMSIDRVGPTLTLLSNGSVLVVGGLSNGPAQYPVSTEIYDPTTDDWSLAASLSTPRVLHTATGLNDGTVLVAGGSSGVYNASSERYDPAANAWLPAGLLNVARGGHTATLLPSGAVIVTGGHNASFSTELH